MWDQQRMLTQKQIILSSIQKNLFFHFMSQQLKYFLIYEKLTEKVYQPGEIVAIQAKRSVMNHFYRPFFDHRATKIRQEIDHKKIQFEVNTGKKHSEIGSLMDVMRENNLIKKDIIKSLTSTLNPKEAETAVQRDTSYIKSGLNDTHNETLVESENHRGDSKAAFLLDHNQDNQSTLLPQCKVPVKLKSV
jgi:hypothetical protein